MSRTWHHRDRLSPRRYRLRDSIPPGPARLRRYEEREHYDLEPRVGLGWMTHESLCGSQFRVAYVIDGHASRRVASQHASRERRRQRQRHARLALSPTNTQVTLMSSWRWFTIIAI